MRPNFKVADTRHDRSSSMAAPTMVILIHGIRTQAGWQRMVKDKFEEIGVDYIVPIKYGYLDLIRFWFPFWTRRKPIERVRSQIEAALLKHRIGHPEEQLTIIAHSFGTYIIGQLLRRYIAFRMNRLILSGSILPTDFDWQRVDKQINETVVNECGHGDIWPVMAQSLSWGYGASGTFGFGSVGVEDRYHAGGHGQYFEPEFVEKFWGPLVQDRILVKSELTNAGAEPRKIMSLLGVVRLRGVIVLALLASILFAGRGVGSYATRRMQSAFIDRLKVAVVGQSYEVRNGQRIIETQQGASKPTFKLVVTEATGNIDQIETWEWLNWNTARITLHFQWNYQRYDSFNACPDYAVEDRTDEGTFTFQVAMDPRNRLSVTEIGRTANDVFKTHKNPCKTYNDNEPPMDYSRKPLRPSHDSAVLGYEGMIRKVFGNSDHPQLPNPFYGP